MSWFACCLQTVDKFLNCKWGFCVYGIFPPLTPLTPKKSPHLPPFLAHITFCFLWLSSAPISVRNLCHLQKKKVNSDMDITTLVPHVINTHFDTMVLWDLSYFVPIQLPLRVSISQRLSSAYPKNLVCLAEVNKRIGSTFTPGEYKDNRSWNLAALHVLFKEMLSMLVLAFASRW